MGEPAELSDHDRDEALQLAHYVIEAVRDGLVYPLAIKDIDAQGEILRMSQYLVELVDPSETRVVTVDDKFGTGSDT